MLIAETILVVWLKIGPDNHYETYVASKVNTYPNLFAFIFVENLLCALAVILFGCIPFGVGTIFRTCLMFGNLCATLKWLWPYYSVKEMLVSTLPHGIFEFTDMYFCVLLSALWSRAVTLAMGRLVARRPVLQKLKCDLLFLGKAIIFVLIPLTFIAAIVEVTITPRLIELMV